MIDIPTGVAMVIVAVITLAGALVTPRLTRIGQLERENRQLWFVCKRMVHLMYINGLEPDPELIELINGKDTP